MKRDLDLFRKIFFEIEAQFSGRDEDINLQLAGFEPIVVNEHVRLLTEGRYVDAHKLPDDEGDFFHYVPIRLTNDGHDFLDAIRSDTIWPKTKTKTIEAGAYTLKLIVQSAIEQAKIALLS